MVERVQGRLIGVVSEDAHSQLTTLAPATSFCSHTERFAYARKWTTMSPDRTG